MPFGTNKERKWRNIGDTQVSIVLSDHETVQSFRHET
jgi:hypothetical protein